jgi:hypothetical protein
MNTVRTQWIEKYTLSTIVNASRLELRRYKLWHHIYNSSVTNRISSYNKTECVLTITKKD